MTRIFAALLLMAPLVLAGESADDLRIYRERYVAQGQPDPAAELEAARNAGDAEWRHDVRTARAFEAASELKFRTDDKAGTQRIERLFPRIAKAAGPRFESVRVRIFRADSVNAFTVGGDRIYVGDSLLRALNDNELAGTLAHELSHIVARHSFRKQALSRRLTVPAAERALALQLYSRICEAEADVYATVLLRKAGIPIVTTQFDKFAKLRPDPRRIAAGLTAAAARIRTLEAEESRLEAAFRRSRDAATFAKLARVKQDLAAARSAHDRLQRARSFLRLTSQRTHPDLAARARFIRAAADRVLADPLIRYVLNGRARRSLAESLVRR